MAAHRDMLDAWEAQASQDGVSLALELDENQLLILSTGAGDVPVPTFLAEVVTADEARDFTVLRITHDAEGRPLDGSSLSLPFVPLGDSALVRQGDPIHLFSYPYKLGRRSR
jgi:hypothetical protein